MCVWYRDSRGIPEYKLVQSHQGLQFFLIPCRAGRHVLAWSVLANGVLEATLCLQPASVNTSSHHMHHSQNIPSLRPLRKRHIKRIHAVRIISLINIHLSWIFINGGPDGRLNPSYSGLHLALPPPVGPTQPATLSAAQSWPRDLQSHLPGPRTCDLCRVMPSLRVVPFVSSRVCRSRRSRRAGCRGGHLARAPGLSVAR